jgi:nicotinate-nucleotide--dimethylbenzimidazole phosphoribosyltransferase
MHGDRRADAPAAASRAPLVEVHPPDPRVLAAARTRVDALAKPVGSLGRLEALAVKLAGAQHRVDPRCERPRIVVFAGDHGVARAHAVSAYPTAVTRAVVDACVAGRSAVAALARAAGAELEIVDVGVRRSPGDAPPRTTPAARAPVSTEGTADICEGPAMSIDACLRALRCGIDVAHRARDENVDVLAAGEIGIGNTTSAAALCARVLEIPARDVVGPGTGLAPEGVARKVAVVQRALARCGRSADPIHALAELGGFDIAALVGLMLGASAHHIPVLVDGFVASTAALIATRSCVDARDYLIPATRSPEPGHQLVLDALAIGEPLLDLGLRLGEGSGAALALPLAHAACRMLGEMVTLDEVVASAASV